jgi:D-aminopeptidase
LDLVVRDAHGKLVTNLKPEDVAIYEDGVRQDMRSFRLVAGKEVRLEDERQAAEAQAAPVTTPAPAARPPVNPLRTVNVV